MREWWICPFNPLLNALDVALDCGAAIFFVPAGNARTGVSMRFGVRMSLPTHLSATEVCVVEFRQLVKVRRLVDIQSA